MKKSEKIIAGIVFLLVGIGVFTTYFKDTWLYTDFFKGFYVKENGIIESLTVVGLLLGAGLCFRRVFALRTVRQKTFLVCTVLLGCCYIFGAGEEISWGQSILNSESPEFFQQHNAQQETNIHNLVVGGTKINKLIFGTILGIFVVVYFSLIPLLYIRTASFKNYIDRLAIPIPRLSHIICYIILGILIALAHSSKHGELLEFGGVWIFLLTTWNPLNQDIFTADTQ